MKKYHLIAPDTKESTTVGAALACATKPWRSGTAARRMGRPFYLTNPTGTRKGCPYSFNTQIHNDEHGLVLFLTADSFDRLRIKNADLI
jgi:hypothetical protein